MPARKPNPREPSCRHPGGEHQPASACRICKDAQFLREWAEGWETWLAENPGSFEAQAVKRMDDSGRYQKTIDRFQKDVPDA